MNKDWLQTVDEKLKKRHVTQISAGDVTLDNLAYTVYSSGTTGKPKGIVNYMCILPVCLKKDCLRLLSFHSLFIRQSL